jgi:hypothetical protein
LLTNKELKKKREDNAISEGFIPIKIIWEFQFKVQPSLGQAREWAAAFFHP